MHSVTEPGRRIADDDIYLNEDRREKPKAIFLKIVDILKSRGAGAGKSCLDVGCATGDLLHHLQGAIPSLALSGVDVSERMLEVAKLRLPDVTFFSGDLGREVEVEAGSFDYCVMSGVLNCFDEVEPILAKLIRWTKAGGSVIILDMINDHPVDVIVRHRKVALSGAGPWEVGWNYTSKTTIAQFLNGPECSGLVSGFSFERFDMPFAIERREDAMRTWTIPTAENRHQLINGANQLINLQFLMIDR